MLIHVSLHPVALKGVVPTNYPATTEPHGLRWPKSTNALIARSRSRRQRHDPPRPLRLRRKRPHRRRAAECSQQLPPSHGDCHRSWHIATVVSRCSNVKPKLLDYLVGNGLMLPGFADPAAFDATLVNLGFGPQLRPSCNRCAPRAARLVLWLRYLFGAVRRPSPRSLRGARPLHTRRPSSR
jgi:hypothetical protein